MIERPCFTPGCPNTTSGQFCLHHAREKERARGTSAQRGYGAKWQRKSKAFLKRSENRTCRCGCGEPSTDVDHIEAVSGPNDPRFWDETNWQPLAHECHGRKTVLEDGGFGNQPASRENMGRRKNMQDHGFRLA